MELANQMRADEQLHRALQVPGTALLGIASDGVPLLIRLASPDVTHLLVSGGKASGKTQVVKTMLASLVLFQKPRDLQLFLIASDPNAFQFLAALPHLNGGVIHTPEEALRRVRWLETEMERREMEGVTRPRLIIVVDEMTEVNKQAGREFQIHLTRLAQRGRGVGISLIASARDGDHSGVSAGLKAHFPVRLVGKTAATARSNGFGQGVFDLLAGGERVRFQAAYLAPDDVPSFHAQVEMNLHPGMRATSFGLSEIMRRIKRSTWARKDGLF
jgi:S-DNA-T family DNA segregation ATPase FtsK/SpoIIIE